MTVRAFFYLVIFLPLWFRPHAADANSVPATDDATTQFCASFADGFLHCLYRAAAIDPLTKQEDAVARSALVRRQRELHTWFRAHGNSVSPATCVTRADRENYRQFRALMGHKRFLALPYRWRLEFIGDVTEYLDVVRRSFAPALQATVWPRHDGASSSDNATRDVLIHRLQRPVSFELRFFNREQYKSVGAYYVPESTTIFVNLDVFTESPAELIDAVEHELWHHLLPPPGDDRLGDNWWWEGFTEAIAERWSDALQPVVAPKRWSPSRSVEYPVETAFASCYLGLAPTATVSYLSGVLSRAEFADSLRGHAAGNGDAGDLSMLLADIYARAPEMGSEKQAKIEQILTDWGWKEDDGARVRIGRMVAGGTLSDAAMTAAFRDDQQLFLDVVQALTIVQMQELQIKVSSATIMATLDLPPSLRENLKRVLTYVRDPRDQLANR